MKALAVAVLASLALAACGTTTTDRSLSGAGLGATVGLLGGPVGVLIGGAAGAAAGATTSPDQVNLGTPVWKS